MRSKTENVPMKTGKKKGLQIAALVIGVILFGIFLAISLDPHVSFYSGIQKASVMMVPISSFIATILSLFYPKVGGWLFIASGILHIVIMYLGYPEDVLSSLPVVFAPMTITGVLWLLSGASMLRHAARKEYPFSCPRCGKEQVGNPAFCRNCGENLRSVENRKRNINVGLLNTLGTEGTKAIGSQAAAPAEVPREITKAPAKVHQSGLRNLSFKWHVVLILVICGLIPLAVLGAMHALDKEVIYGLAILIAIWIPLDYVATRVDKALKAKHAAFENIPRGPHRVNAVILLPLLAVYISTWIVVPLYFDNVRSVKPPNDGVCDVIGSHCGGIYMLTEYTFMGQQKTGEKIVHEYCLEHAIAWAFLHPFEAPLVVLNSFTANHPRDNVFVPAGRPPSGVLWGITASTAFSWLLAGYFVYGAIRASRKTPPSWHFHYNWVGIIASSALILLVCSAFFVFV